MGAAERQMLGLAFTASIAVEEKPKEASETIAGEKGAEKESHRSQIRNKGPEEDETDRKVREMVEKTKKFAEGREETAADLLKQVEKENPE